MAGYALFCVLLASAFEKDAAGQSTTYHFHAEQVSPYSVPTLRTANPDAASTFIETQNYRKVSSGFLDTGRMFRSVAPSPAGTIPSNATVTFSVWLKKSANSGTIYPYFKAWTYDNGNPLTGNLVSLCSVTGTSPGSISTTLKKFTLSCATSSAIVMTASRAYRLDVGAYVATGPGNQNVTVQIYFEGTLNGNYDSTVSIPNPLSPSITGLSPTVGNTGTSVTVTGLRFGATQATSAITFNGVAAGPTSWTDTSIQVPVPATSTGPVVVTVDGVASNGMTFTVPGPSISGVSPGSGGVGASVTITGSGFGDSFNSGTTSVRFNGVTTTPTSWSNTSIQAPVPATTTGPLVVRINGVDSNSVNFTVTVLSISGISPASGPVGTPVTIAGSGFGTSYNPATMSVRFNGIAATPANWSDTSITASVPTTTSGPVVVRINGVDSNGITFSIVPSATLQVKEYIYLGDRVLAVETDAAESGTSAHSILGISPSSGVVGTPVTITGSGFGTSYNPATMNVLFNGVAATPANWSESSIEAAVPPTTPGPVVVRINGVESNSFHFSVTAGHSLTGISPAGGDVGTLVTIAGSGFGASYNSATMGVRFNGVAATPTSWTNTSIEVPVPLTASGPVVVRINGLDSNGVQFTVTATHSISGISPAGGPVGTPVTITGTGFGAAYDPAIMSVTFNGVVVTPTSWTNTSIVATVPSTTSGPVVVRLNGVDSNNVNFTVGAWLHYRALTVNHTLVPSTQTNFPVLVAKTHPDFRTTSNGGFVQTMDGTKPADLAFFANAILTTPLDFELERYDPTTGELLAWVRIPSLSSSSDTVFYVAYGNSAITVAQDHPTAVWDSNFKYVGHLPNGAALNAADTTVYGNNGTLVNSPTATQGKFDGAANLVAGSAQHVSLPANFNHGSGAATWSAWVKAASLPNAYNAVIASATSNNSQYSQIFVKSNGKLAISVRTDFPAIYGSLTYDGTGSNTLMPGNWYHIVMTAAYTGGSPASRMRGYVNGALDGVAPNTAPLRLTSLTQPVLIGRDSINSLDWNGVVDEVRISNVERSADWILTEFNTGAAPDLFLTMGGPLAP
jgi:hypothetical protein